MSTSDLPTAETLRALTGELSLPGLHWGIAELGETGELFPEEARAMARAVPLRRMEFLAGRLAARRALAGLGRPAVAVPMAEDRAPVWPEGVVGSISHAAGLAVAVVAEAPALLGVDIAKLEPFEAALIPEICRPEERALIPLEGQGLFACSLFSAKEAAFKAQYPVTGLIFGFHGLRLDFARGIAEYTDHPDLATLRHESRQPLPVAQRQSAGLILSLSVRFG